MKYYAVRRGRRVGIYPSWEQCKAQVERYPGAEYKAFPSLAEAKAFLEPAQHPLPERSPRRPRRTPIKPKPARGVHVWVDGACIQESTGQRRIGWAYIVVDNGIEIHRASGRDIPVDTARHRNVAGEITAVLRALAWCQAHGITAVTIHHDYQGLASWATGAWKANTPLTKMYAQVLRDSGVKIRWKKVAAHSGEYYNELVDQLARHAALGEPCRSEPDGDRAEIVD